MKDADHTHAGERARRAGRWAWAEGRWHRPKCACGSCRAPSATADAGEQGILTDAVQTSPGQETDLRDWPGPQRTAMRLRRPRSPVPLSLAEVRESGLPALLLDFGEALLYLEGEIFEVDASWAPSRAGLRAVPLPTSILATGVGIDYGWHHAGHCACRFCSKGGRPDAQEESVA